MKIFIDTANIEEIKEAHNWGIVDGVTTNPSLIAREGRDFKEVVREICAIVDGPISAEVVSLDAEGMIKEADGNYPTSTVISKNNGGLYNAIRKYYGGHRVVKMRMGYCHDEMTVLEQLMEELAS